MPAYGVGFRKIGTVKMDEVDVRHDAIRAMVEGAYAPDYRVREIDERVSTSYAPARDAIVGDTGAPAFSRYRLEMRYEMELWPWTVSARDVLRIRVEMDSDGAVWVTNEAHLLGGWRHW